MQTRREFLIKMAMATSGLALPWKSLAFSDDKFGKTLPLRKLGKTGEKVTILGLGGFHLGEPTEKEVQEIIEYAIDRGIRFFDNAHAYANGNSEKYYGKFLIPKYRDDIFLMTKTKARDYKTAKYELEESLRRMKTDYVDLWQLHSLIDPNDVDERINKGVLKAVEEALKENKIRHAGFTGHNSPRAMLRILELTRGAGLFVSAQMPVNVVDALNNPSFVTHVMPKLVEQEIAILGMKSLADGRFFNKKVRNNREIWTTETPVVPNYISVKEATDFALSMPVSSLMIGANKIEYLKEKISIAENFVSYSEQERKELVVKLAEYPLLKNIEYYKKDASYKL